MSRDVIYFTALREKRFYINYNASPSFTDSKVDVITDSMRSDPVTTIPVKPGGSYYRATGYGARFYYGSSSGFDYNYDSGYYRYEGESAAGDASAEFDKNYGLDGLGDPSISGSVISACESYVRSNLMSQDMNIGQTIGELPETVAFIAQLAKAILAMLRAIRSGDTLAIALAFGVSKNRVKRDVKRVGRTKIGTNESVGAVDVAASLWLLYSFAWKPLLSDIYATMKLMREGLDDPAAFSASATLPDPLREPFYKTTIEFYGPKSWSAKREVTVKVYYRISNPFLLGLDSLGLLDPLAIAWELVPLSFVVDWFLPIGNFLDALSGPFGVEFSTGYRTRYLEYSWEVGYVFTPIVYPVKGSTPRYGARQKCFRRDPYIGFPIPVPYFRGVGNLSIGQIISAMALAVVFR